MHGRTFFVFDHPNLKLQVMIENFSQFGQIFPCLWLHVRNKKDIELLWDLCDQPFFCNFSCEKML
jgi:hypothetical protein